MNWKEEIPELTELLIDYKQKRSKAKSAYNKYKSKIEKYYFLDVIVKPKEHKTGNEGLKEDADLEIAIRDLFNSIYVESVRPKKKDDFDVKSHFKTFKFGIEVKNTGNVPGENEMFQSVKYKMRLDTTCHALVIWNNSKVKEDFNENRNTDAKNFNYGIMTTEELLNGYMKLKKGAIGFDEFLGQLNKSGIIKFSLKALGKSKNSKAPR
jgi:hypothetical protein